MIGSDNARRGATKLFETLQIQERNRHLIHVFLELLLQHAFPELVELDASIR